MALVTREQFKIRSELEVVHIPTGAVFSAYPYSNPDDMLESIRVNWSRGSARAVQRSQRCEGVADKRRGRHFLLFRTNPL